MSAPDTNLKKQEKRHKGPLLGMGAMVAFAAVLLLGLVVWLVASGNEPRDAAVPTDTGPSATVPDNG